MKVHLGLFGRGPWSDKILATLARCPDSEVVWRRGRNWREDPIPGMTLDRDGVLRSTQVHGVIIATAAPTHAQLALQFIRAGVPCFIEKPMAMNPIEASALSYKWRESSKPPVVVNHAPLYSPAYRLMRMRIRGKRVTSAEVTMTGPGPYRPNCSPLWDYGPHAAAVAVDLLGPGPFHIVAEDAQWQVGQIQTFHVSPFRVRTPVVTLRFGNGDSQKTRTVVVQADGERYEADTLVEDPSPLSVALDRFIRMARNRQLGESEVIDMNLADLDLGYQVTMLLHALEGFQAGEVA